MTVDSSFYVPNGKQQFVNGSGVPLANGKVYMYIPSTTTPKNTWQDPNQTTLNANPITLDSNGMALIYGTGDYRQQVYDQNRYHSEDQKAKCLFYPVHMHHSFWNRYLYKDGC